jgi:hypothetical protein
MGSGRGTFAGPLPSRTAKEPGGRCAEQNRQNPHANSPPSVQPLRCTR